MTAPIPTRVHYHKQDRELELGYGENPGKNSGENSGDSDAGGENYRLSAEYLRVFSPSAEVRGHGPDTATLQTGMKYVGLKNITQTGRYALKLHFDDGHDTGLYSWDYLYDLAINQKANWADYLRRLEEANASRESLGIPLKQL